MVVYAVVDETLSPASPLGDAIDVFVRRADAERFIKQIQGDEPQLAVHLRIEERALEAGGQNWALRAVIDTGRRSITDPRRSVTG